MGKVIGTLISVAVGLGGAAGLFVGYNKLVDQARPRWPVLTGGVGAALGLVLGAILQHNDIAKIPGVNLGIWDMPDGALTTLILGPVVFGLIGYLLGAAATPNLESRTRWEARLRPGGFVGPAVLFVTFGLVVPSLRTIIVSFRDGKRGDGDFTLAQYDRIFSDDDLWTLEGFGDIFTSRLFIVGLFAIVFAVIAAWASTQRFHGTSQAGSATITMRLLGGGVLLVAGLAVVGFIEAVVREPNRSSIYDALTVLVSSRASLIVVVLVAALLFAAWLVLRLRPGIVDEETTELDWSTPTSSLTIVFGVILLLFAALSTMQSLIWNNLWWVVTVAGLSTVLGLLLAMLADRVKSEKYAKTMIFMPMAISMVGAAVIWDYVYNVQPGDTQIGVLNSIIQGLGFEARGFFINSSAIPWNNVSIMVIMIWIQTGFAMVVLSAAIKAVPDELLEAARVDGASEVQAFWRVIVPQITATILVVLTTLIIIVMKVFDLVKATTNGANSTDVLANAMFNQLRDGNFSLSSAFAVLIFVLTLPVMVYNIRRTQRDLA
ncbi:MAG: sugar ABC transporter permease [Actinomycetota bacterium]